MKLQFLWCCARNKDEPYLTFTIFNVMLNQENSTEKQAGNCYEKICEIKRSK